MQDPIISANGQYGIEGLEALIDTGIAVQRGYQLVVADDGKVDVNDAPDLFIFGPPLFSALSHVAAKRRTSARSRLTSAKRRRHASTSAPAASCTSRPFRRFCGACLTSPMA